MLDRDNMIMTINNLFQTIFDYQDRIDYLNSEIEKITEDTVRNAAKAKLIYFEELVHELEAEVIVLVANVLVNRFEEKSTSKKNEESD